MNSVTIIPKWDMDDEQWHEARSKGIGGSDAGALCGVNHYKSPYTLWAEKTGIVPNDFEGNEATKWGNRLERPIAQGLAEDYEFAVVDWPVILVSKENPFMFANIDFLIVKACDEFPAGIVTTWRFREPPPDIQGILEVKTSGIASFGSAPEWKDGGIPLSYQLQGYHYGIVLGVHNVVFAALIGGEGLQVRSLEWDDEIAQDLVIAEAQFWEMVLNGEEPPVDGSDSTEEAQKKRYARHTTGKQLQATREFVELWDEFEAAKEAAKEADEERKRLRAEIVKMIGDAESVLVGEDVICTYKTSKDVERLDGAALKEAMPEIWERFKKVGPGPRSLKGVK